MASWPQGSGNASSLRGEPVAPTAPTTGQALVFDGTQWVPTTPVDQGLTQLTGDVTASGSGSQPATVVGLQGQPVADVAPTTLQVLQWDGAKWVPGAIPTGGSGGGGVVYFLDQSTAAQAPTTGLSAPTVKALSITPDASGSSVTISNISTSGYTALAGFVTNVGVPATTTITPGLWDFNLWVDSDAAADVVSLRVTVYKYNGTTTTQIAQSVAVPVYDPAATTQYAISVVMPQTAVLDTDRLYVLLEATSTIASKSITLYFGDSYPSHVHSTIPSVVGTGLVHVIGGVVQSPASPVALAADVSGTLPVANGGTGLTSAGGTANRVVLTTDGSTLAMGQVPNAALANSSVTVSAGTGLTGGGSVALGGTTTLSLSGPVSVANGGTGLSSAGGVADRVLYTPDGSTFAFAALPNGSLANSSVTVSAGDGLSGGGTVALGGTTTLSLSTPVTVARGGTGLTSAGTSGNVLVSDGSVLASVAVSGDASLVSTGAATVKGLQGRTVAATAPSSGQALAWDGLQWAPATISSGINQLTGDVTAGPGTGSQATTVARLQGRTMAATAPSSGQYLGWDGLQWAPSTPPDNGITQLTGDVTTASGSGSQAATVAKIQGFAVATTIPSADQVLSWNSGTSKWTPTTISATGNASGDLSGTYPGPTVAAIQGRTVATTSPSNGQALVWVSASSQWAPGTITATGSASGDLSGSYPSPTVAKVQGRTVATTAPTDGQALVWSSGSSQWAPGSITATGSASGDLSGSYPSPTVAKLLGRALNSTAPTTNQAYVYDGSQWTASGVAKSGTWSLTGITGDAYGLPVFSASGNPTVLAPPVSKTNAVLGWLADGTMGWVTAMASILLFATSTYISDVLVSEGTEFVVELDGSAGMFTAEPGGYFDTATGIV